MQTSVNDALQVGLPGQLYGVNKDVISRCNYSKQLDKIAPDAADTTTVVTINGTAYTYTTDGSDTKAQIAEGLATSINAGTDAITAYYTAAAEYLTVESDVVGTANTVVGTTSCTITNQIANAAAIDFGLVVCQDPMDEKKAKLPVAAADITSALSILGITVHTQAIEQFYQSAGGAGYAINAEMSILKRGTCWVQVESAVTPATTPYARYTVNGTTKLGGIRGDDDTSKAAIIPSARFVKGAAANGYALLEINLP